VLCLKKDRRYHIANPAKGAAAIVILLPARPWPEKSMAGKLTAALFMF
jgi:hypothetical protein